MEVLDWDWQVGLDYHGHVDVHADADTDNFPGVPKNVQDLDSACSYLESPWDSVFEVFEDYSRSVCDENADNLSGDYGAHYCDHAGTRQSDYAQNFHGSCGATRKTMNRY
jgi:hypothetical protein